jgi:hypothetical protein
MMHIRKDRLRSAKAAFSTRRVTFDAFDPCLLTDRAPATGDLVLARVDLIGSHKGIELPSGRKAQLFVGNEVILAYGNRYAPDQYEAYVPNDLGPCHMVAAGGVAARAEAWHESLRGPTEITPICLIGAADQAGVVKPINLADFALPAQLPAPAAAPAIFAVFGTSMNAGKTATAAAIVKGFADAGHTVGALKITGTAAGGDLWLMRDSGAFEVLDFTDAGFATTFGNESAEVLKGAHNLIATLATRGCDVIVIEVADGLFQRETSEIARDSVFLSRLTGTFFAAGDAMGAVEGVAKLRSFGHTVLGVGGAFTRSPLAMREAREAANLPVMTLAHLMEPVIAATFLANRIGGTTEAIVA